MGRHQWHQQPLAIMISENSEDLDWPVLNCDHLLVYFFFYFSPHLLCFYADLHWASPTTVTNTL